MNNKLLKRLTVFVLVLLLSFSAIGCRQDNGVQIDKTKTQLYVMNYDGGFGHDWLDAVITRFTAATENVEYTPGKFGVQIITDNTKDDGINLIKKVKSATINEIFFTGNMVYYEWLSSELMLDITDVVTNPNSFDVDNKTIESKMNKEQKDFFKYNEKYYALPHGNAYFGINYDIDLFESKQLYYAINAAPSEDYALDKEEYGGFDDEYGVLYTGKGAKSAGPDGLHGTSDDGLPATYDEFFELCAYMKSTKGVTPFIWSGTYASFYVDYLLAALMSDYEGLEQSYLNYTFDGVAKNLISVSDSGVITKLEETPITSESGYKIYATAGRYYALKFLENIIKNNHAISSSFGSTSHTDAQSIYVNSSYNNKPIAFIVEGNWWVNEATSAFNYMETYYGEEYSKINRRFGFMPLPKATNEQIGEESTLFNTDISYGFIKSNIDSSKVKLAKDFLRFCFTDISMREYTVKSGGVQTLKYSLEQEDLNQLSIYNKQVWDLHNNAKIVHPISTNQIFRYDQFGFSLYNTFDTSVLSNACSAIYDNKATAESFFNGIVSKYNKTIWESSYNRFFD